MAATLRPEVFRNGHRALVARDEKGRFASGSTAFKPLEFWATRDGVKPRFADRDERGHFLPATNYKVVL